jgi:hypothetical protein
VHLTSEQRARRRTRSVMRCKTALSDPDRSSSTCAIFLVPFHQLSLPQYRHFPGRSRYWRPRP